jgi:segregation and condensation protein A
MNLARASDKVRIHITDFEGPLDLLLHLIRENKLDIKTVKLAEVTGQYLAFMSGLDSLDLDLASEFIEVGATLIEIKGKQILPSGDEEKLDAEEMERRLLQQIEEYKLLKEASEKLKVIENVDRFYKEPAKLKTEYKFVLDNLNMDALVAAFQKMMFRVERNAPMIIETQIKLDRFTVADKIKSVRVMLGFCDSVNFFDLFPADYTKGEIINTFLALLELLKRQEVRAVQESRFADICIVKGDAFGVVIEDEVLDYEVVGVGDGEAEVKHA